MRFTFFGIKIVIDPERKIYGVQIGRDWAIICHKKVRRKPRELADTTPRRQRRPSI